MKKIILLSCALLLSYVSISQNGISRSRLLTQDKYTLNQRQLPPNALKDSLWEAIFMPGSDGTPIVASGSYTNPTWIASLAWTKITGTPTTVAGYGITDAVPYTGATTNLNFNNKILTFSATATNNGFIEMQRSGIAGPSSGAANTLRIGASTTGQLVWNTQNAGSTDGFRRTMGGTLTGHRTYTLKDADGTLAFTSDITAITNSFVPYTGATSDVNLGTKTIVAANLLSGQYTPTLTNTSNITASTTFTAQYYRVGNMVTVFGRVEVNPTLALATPTELEITLPIASTFGYIEELSGTAVTTDATATAGKIQANGSNTASLMFNALSASNDSWAFHFSYIVQ